MSARTKNLSHAARPPLHRHSLYARVCTLTGKRVYATRRLARTARARICTGPLSIYRCDACEGFHLGHLPRAVVAGVQERPR